MKKNGIVIMAIGDDYLNKWKVYSKASVEKYCDRFNLELVLITQVPDSSERANARSSSWQKCLIGNLPETKNLNRLLWMDSDIVVNNANAENLFDIVPQGKIGGSEAFTFFNKPFYRFILSEMFNYWEKQGIQYIHNLTGNEFYRNFGIETDLNEVIQCGVFLMEPDLHNEIFERAYYQYEDKGSSAWNYEMRPLSYEIMKSGLFHEVDDRYNFLVSNYLTAFYPEAQRIATLSKTENYLLRLMNYLKVSNIKVWQENYLEKAIVTAYSNAGFLHFAGCQNLIPVLKTRTELSKQDFM